METLLGGEEKPQDTSSRPSHAPRRRGSQAGETGPENRPLGSGLWSGIDVFLAPGSPFIPSFCLAWGQLQELANGGCHSWESLRMRKQAES